jgi:hypothetical protein
MSSVAKIKSAIKRLSRKEAGEVLEWLDHWLENPTTMAPEFEVAAPKLRSLPDVAACMREQHPLGADFPDIERQGGQQQRDLRLS